MKTSVGEFRSKHDLRSSIWLALAFASIGISARLLILASKQKREGLLAERENRAKFRARERAQRWLTPVRSRGGGSALGPAEHERQMAFPPENDVDEASFESFPASDPPSHW